MILRLSLLLATAGPAAALAQDKPARDDDIVIVAPDRTGDCITRRADGERQVMLDCLSRSLANGGETGAPPRPDTAAAAGRQPPSRTGTFSHTATAQRMGNNFGRSARPQRPAPPVFAPPARAPQ